MGLDDAEAPRRRQLRWVGDSRENIRSFPEEVQDDIGYGLYFIQTGEIPKDAKRLTGLGSGMIQITSRHDKNTYRVVVAVQIGSTIYVLHAFQKKSKRGIATPKQDIDLIKRRYREAQEIERNERERMENIDDAEIPYGF